MFKKVVIGILTVLNILMLIALWQSRPNMPENQVQKSKIEQNQQQTNNLKKRTKLLTTSSVSASVAKQAVNLDEAKNKSNKVINDSFNAVYNNAKSEDDLKKLKKDLPKIAGPSLSQTLLTTEKLQLNNQGQRALSYTKLNGVKVGYGTYDISTGDLPVIALVDYQDLSDKQGHALWKMTYNVKSNAITAAKVTPMNK
ncbi:hypothetical protein LMB49_03810 [Limosilactobacillus reuteri]|uniref:hypothetical protein n=1 Tax=Limosilactobacillus reuteri TaxID=1598 RepID=UPI001E553C0E|nr:hypothetical protein [Limosilactobacillus reuteri]MCC4370523.1 hypothetical protein [Limosilactobacillus reuteri]MCC4509422.1 hypothetical protein [Limosilactobacillus reuteri]